MKIGIIVNSISRKRKIFDRKFLPALRQHFEVEVWETRSENHAGELAQKAAVDILISAGGDGNTESNIEWCDAKRPATRYRYHSPGDRK